MTREAPTSILTATGKVPGPRGMATRQRLLDEVERRSLEAHYSSIAVADIAAAAETSAATFYHYFPDVAAAATEVAQSHLARFESVLDLADAVVAESGSMAACVRFVTAFYDYWEGRSGLIEAIVVASRDEDPRFFRVLLQALFALTSRLAKGVRAGDPTGVAGSLTMMLSHGAARQAGFARDGVPLPVLIDSQARIVHAALSA